MHVAYGYGLFTGGLGAHYGAERLGLATIPVSGGMTERQVQLILQQPELSPHYVMELSKEGPLDHLTVLVEIAPGKTDSSSSETLKHNIKSLIGIRANVKIVPISSIERSIGKAKREIDKRSR